jgi:hypothetical protein
MVHSTVICVLGMHRSGTSLITRALNLLGVDLGRQDHLMKANPYNPKGFWEHRLIMQLNDEILSRLGGCWDEPPIFPPGWQRAPEFEDLGQRARAVIEKEFADAAAWGWKDPRTCLTLPFWQQLLPSMRYVICLRNPVDVVRSLERRDGFAVEKGIYLWLAYTKSALEHTVGQERIFVAYEDFLDHWRPELQRLARFVGKSERAGQADVQGLVQGSIDRDLQHHRSSAVDEVEELTSGPAADALHAAQRVSMSLRQEEPLLQSDLHQTLQEGLDLLGSEVCRDETGEKQKKQDTWMQQLHLATEEVSGLIPAGTSFILADEDRWETDAVIAGRRRLPFPEQNGQYGGRPPDDETAIREFERLRRTGASLMVFGWPAFWWLEYYVGLHQHLRSHFPCVLQNDRLVAFDLRP